MLKKSASFVLASRRGSTLRKEFLEGRKHRMGFSVRQDPLKGRTAHTKCGLYLLASSLAAALLGARRVLARRGLVGEKGSLFEHPVAVRTSVPFWKIPAVFMDKPSFSIAY